MNNLKGFLIYILLLTTLLSKAQTGEYIGKYVNGPTYHYSKSGKSRKLNTDYLEKKLILKSDSTFTFEYEPLILFASAPFYQCEGKWKLINDIIVLNSKYSSNDYLSVSENNEFTTHNDLLILTFRTELGFYSGQLYLNDKFITTIDRDDTIYYKCDNVNNIRIKFSYPGDFTYLYIPKDKKSNLFSFIIKPSIEGNNMSLTDCKLLMKNGEIIPLSKGPLFVDTNYIKLKP
jgi:hypothetical protein